MERGGLVPKSSQGTHINIEGLVYNTTQEAVAYALEQMRKKQLAATQPINVTIDPSVTTPGSPVVLIDHPNAQSQRQQPRQQVQQPPPLSESFFGGLNENELSLI